MVECYRSVDVHLFELVVVIPHCRHMCPSVVHVSGRQPHDRHPTSGGERTLQLQDERTVISNNRNTNKAQSTHARETTDSKTRAIGTKGGTCVCAHLRPSLFHRLAAWLLCCAALLLCVCVLCASVWSRGLCGWHVSARLVHASDQLRSLLWRLG